MASAREDADEGRVEAILGRWFERRFAGESADLAVLCADAPHLLPRVRAMLARHDALLGPGTPERSRPAAARGPLPVDRLGGFELKSRIGAGGMGDVYVAREIALDRIVALKVLRRDLCDDPIRRLRFKREAQLTAALDHPHIVPVYGTGEDQGHVFLVMKHLPGTTLDRVPARLTPRRVALIGARVARALHAAHEVGIVHRDVKPGNVQCDGDDVWVLDFGLARGRVDLTLTTAGQAPGTLAYMPPEQLRGDGTGPDPRGDIYSLGATLYECLAGRPPFADDRPEALVRRALLHEPDPLRLPLADRDLATIVMRALDKDPRRRFPTAVEFAADLERFLAGEPIRSRPPSTLARAARFARRHRVVSAAVLAACAVALVLVPQLARNASERRAEVDREFGVVDAALAEGLPAVALERLREIGQQPAALGDPRLAERQDVIRATLARDALLDRIQFDSVYFEGVPDAELAGALAAMPSAVRDQPLTIVALLFVALQQDNRGDARRLLGELERSRACCRLAAAFRARLDGRDLGAALRGVEVGRLAAVDHVFTAVLLRISNAAGGLVQHEVERAFACAPTSIRVRMMVAIRHLIGGDSRRAREALTLLWDERQPRAELHCVIARLAILEADFELAARHLALADAALAATERPPNRWLELARIILAVERGDLDRAVAELTAARARFGDDEWFLASEAAIALARDDLAAAGALLEDLVTAAHVPWNRRRANAALLEVAAREWEARPTVPAAEAIIARAERVAAAAAAVEDAVSGTKAEMVVFDVAKPIADALFESGDSAGAARWEARYCRALTAVFALDDLHAGATYEACLYVTNRILDPARAPEAELELGDLIGQTRRRALALVDLGRAGERRVDDLLALAVFGALLSAEAGDAPAATRAGAIAAELAANSVPEPEADLLALLRRARERLGLAAWPQPPSSGR
ncbi:MAG: serine/threonine protein kinase [Planctomycetes bacterium]|nr:serine/threonine protein kinase [Planctomycetota bacterium]